MSEARASWWRVDGDGIVVEVRVQPNARGARIAGIHDGRLAVRVSAPAVEGKANAALVATLASAFGVRTRAVELLRGDHAREKTVRITGIAAPPPMPTLD